MKSTYHFRILSFFLGILSFCLLGQTLVAQPDIPRLLSWQGVLTDQFRAPVPDGDYTITVRLYDQVAAVNPVWEETERVRTFDGVFTTLLGDQTPLGLIFDRPYWLAIELQGEPEMTPRIPLVAAPYALNAAHATVADSVVGGVGKRVESLNGANGNLQLVGRGGTTVVQSGDTLIITSGGDRLPTGGKDGEVIRWNAGSQAWEPAEITVQTAPRLTGDGSTSSPLDIGQMGATDGQVLAWDNLRGIWSPGSINFAAQVISPLRGDGRAGAPLALQDGGTTGQFLFWSGSAWGTTASIAPNDGEGIVWDGGTGTWRPGRQVLALSPRLAGDGSTAAPLDIAGQGATDGQVLLWDGSSSSWKPGNAFVVRTPPFTGNGSAAAPLALTSGTNSGQILFWNGTEWKVSTARTPRDGELLRWSAGVGGWEPMGVGVTNQAPLSRGSIWVGGANDTARQVAIGSGNQVLAVNSAGTAPEWSSALRLDSINTGDLHVRNNTTIDGDLTVSGANVNLPNGSIDNAELANSSVSVNYGAGLSGDASVALGGTLNVQNTGVISASAGAGINVSNTNGAITIENAGLLSANAGAGIDVTTTNGAATIANTGVLSLAGTSNQVNVDQSTGAVTLSLPQAIHTDATPTFDGLTLDNINTSSTANQIVVSNNGSIESRSFVSLFPGGLLPQGSNTNATLRWNGTAWVENTGLTSDGSGNVSTTGNTTVGGDLTVSGTNVNLPNGSIDNTELANSSVNVNYGTGLSGDASVALGGILNVQNTGVISASAGTGINVSNTNGAITIDNTGLLSANAGAGIDVTTANGAATIANTGVLSLSGTSNQVNVDQATGAITLSLPQAIHTDATPTFDGLTLDNINTSSAANQIVVSNNGSIESRSFVSLFPGGLLPQGSSANSTLRWNGTAWVENVGLSADASGNTTIANDLTVSGANVNLPNGSIDNGELANSSVSVNYGAGLSGDASVALGGTLNVQNTGVISASAGTGINVSNTNGAITIDNTGLLSANAGAGISVSTTNGAATIANIGVLSLSGTSNQVNVDQATGAVTLSLPQAIHTDATPTFDGLTLDNINTSSAANQIVVSNNGNIESRSFVSLFPGGLLPQGSSANATLRWNGTAWVENTGLTSDGSGNVSTSGNTTVGGNLTVSGTTVNLPNGSIDNTELANSSVNVNYGTGLSGDASVVLGGTLNVQNTGVTSASAGAGIAVDQATGGITITNSGVTGLTAGNGITLDQATGNVTVTNAGLLSANAGAGISVTTTNGVATVANSGVLSLAGTANQVNVDQSTGAITLSLPQDIHTDATPRFDGLTLDNLNTSSTASQIVVSNNGSIESRSFVSLIGSLPLTQNAIFVGNNSNNVSELISTNDPSALLQQNGSGVPTWSPFSSVVTAIADSLGSTIWKTTGNAGTNPSNHFVGTTDNQPLIVRVNNDTALRILPGATPSLVGGNGANSIATGVIGGVIAGGGDDPSPNQVNADYGAIVGGIRHRANAYFTFIGGGQTNIIDTLANESVIGGGFVNTIDTGASQSVIVGGVFQTIGNYARYATIAGGARNRVDSGARISLIAGGQDHLIGKGNYGAAILGGLEDTIQNGSFYATIGGGQKNLIDGALYAGIFSGTNNRVGGSSTGAAISGGEGNAIRFSGRWGTISGGRNNTIDSTADYSSIGGGQNNFVGRAAWHSRIGGGLDNKVQAISTMSTISGGRNNLIDTATNAVIGGGINNTVNRIATGATVSGGDGNRVGFSGRWGTISGGKNNLIDSTADYSSIGGGESNYLGRATWHSRIGGGFANRITATSITSAILGGRANVIDSANNSAIVGGRGLTMKGDNSFGFHANPAGNNDMVVSDPNIALFGNVDLWLASNDGVASKLKFFKQTFGEGPYPGATSYSSFEAATGQTSNIEYILPDSAGIVGDILSVKSVAGNRISLDWGTGGGAGWSVTGNAGTNPSANFIGTTDDIPVVIRVNNDTVMRYVHDSLSPIIVGGYNGNRVGAGSYGSVIAGGGLDGTQATIPQPNLIGQSSLFGAIGGGWANEIGDYTEGATVSGGKGNIIGDTCLNSTISGGRNNSISDSSTYSVIGGGLVNNINANLATLAGGHFNVVQSDYGVVGGGYSNRLGAGASLSAIVGGESNNIQDSIVNSFIGGGRENAMYQGGGFSTISGGDSNRIWNATTHGTIAGGRRNIIQDTTIASTITGGGINTIGRYADYGTIAGGHINQIGFGSDFSSIAGGEQNTIADTSLYSTIGGGNQNYIGSYSNNATIAGGAKDSIIGNGDFSSILGGLENKIGQDGRMSAIIGGWGLTLTGSRSFGFHGNSFFGTNPMTVSESQVAVLGNVNLWLANNDSSARQIRFYEPFRSTGAFPGPTGTQSFYTSFEAPGLTDTIRYILPATKGTAGDVLEIAAVNGDVVTLEWDTDDNSSDVRFKQNIRTLTGALDSTLMLRGVRYDWRRDEFSDRHFPESESIGFIAQEVEQIFPELVETESDGFKKVEYAKVTALLVEALREQQGEIDAQREEIDELREMLLQMKNMLRSEAEQSGTSSSKILQ